MNIIESIISKIIPKSNAQTAQPSTGRPSPLQPQQTQQPSTVDIDQVLKGMAEKRGGQKLDYQHSIVDLMKMLDMDSSLEARKKLARELNYTGDMNDSARMNIWLHEQVIKKLEENGGQVPQSMKH